MSEIYVGELADFLPGGRRVITAGDLEIGVLLYKSRLYAYRNECLHQGGPACEGMIIAKVEDVLANDQTYVGQRFDDKEMHFVCPWHGYEYDLETGECVPNRRLKLQKFDVVQKGESVYVIV